MHEHVSTRFIDKALTAARIALPLVVVVFALAPAGAWGAADVIRNSGNNFDKPTYYSDQGDLVQYEHTGGSPHNVVSTQFSGGERLFESATISSGTTPVNGTQLLAPGTYPFVCTIHAGMDAELVVRDTGDPPPGTDPPPPGTDPPPPGTDPSDTNLDGAATAKMTQKKMGKKIVVKVNVKAQEDLRAEADGAVKVGKKSYKLKPTTKDVSSGNKTTLKLVPKKKMDKKKIVKALKKGNKARAKVTVKLTDEAGNKESEKLKVKLKR